MQSIHLIPFETMYQILFFCRGRIQHKTTIKLTHFPEGSSDSVVINVPTDNNNAVPTCDNNAPVAAEACCSGSADQGQNNMMPQGYDMNAMYGNPYQQYGQQYPQVCYSEGYQQPQYPYCYGQSQGEYYSQQNCYPQYGYPPC